MKQRTLITTVIALATLALTAAPAVAQETRDKRLGGLPVPVPAEKIRTELKERFASTTNRLLERKAEVKERIASSTERKVEKKVERKAEMEVRKASSTERRIERQQDIAKRQAEHVIKTLTATIERLEKILARIESRIEKIKAEGKDVSLAEGFVVEVKAYLADAQVSLEALAFIDLSADKAKENFERVRAAVAEVKIHLRAAHESLMKAIRALKGSNSAEVKVE